MALALLRLIGAQASKITSLEDQVLSGPCNWSATNGSDDSAQCPVHPRPLWPGRHSRGLHPPTTKPNLTRLPGYRTSSTKLVIDLLLQTSYRRLLCGTRRRRFAWEWERATGIEPA